MNNHSNYVRVSRVDILGILSHAIAWLYGPFQDPTRIRIDDAA